MAAIGRVTTLTVLELPVGPGSHVPKSIAPFSALTVRSDCSLLLLVGCAAGLLAALPLLALSTQVLSREAVWSKLARATVRYSNICRSNEIVEASKLWSSRIPVEGRLAQLVRTRQAAEVGMYTALKDMRVWNDVCN